MLIKLQFYNKSFDCQKWSTINCHISLSLLLLLIKLVINKTTFRNTNYIFFLIILHSYPIPFFNNSHKGMLLFYSCLWSGVMQVCIFVCVWLKFNILLNSFSAVMLAHVLASTVIMEALNTFIFNVTDESISSWCIAWSSHNAFTNKQLSDNRNSLLVADIVHQ